MQSKALTVKDYLKELPTDRASSFIKLRDTILNTIPKGFEEVMSYGMVSYVVPHAIYPEGYHCDPRLPLQFTAIASQKNFIVIYHMGIYGSPKLYDWFVTEYPKHCKTKLDMGKSCIRFKKTEDIPYKLIAELMAKITVKDWIILYQENYLKHKK